MIFTGHVEYQGRWSWADVSPSTKSVTGAKLVPQVDWLNSQHNHETLVKLYKEQLENSQEALSAIVEFEKTQQNVVITCDCENEEKCHRVVLAEYLQNKFNITYGGEIGQDDNRTLQNLDRLELDENIESALFDKSRTSEAKVRSIFETIWKESPERSIHDCIKEYEETNDNYKQSLDIPTPQALVDMACMDKGYLEIKTELVRGSSVKCCRDHNGDWVANDEAGRLDQMCFTELCVAHRGRVYRLEERSGKEMPKYQDIQWLQEVIGCSLQEANEFNQAFKDIELGSKEIYRILFGGSSSGQRVTGIQKTGNQYLSLFKSLQEEMNKFKLVDKFEQYSEIENIDQEYNDEFEVIESNFEEDERFDTSLYTAKRLSIDEESLSEEEIAEIKYGSFEQYKEVLARYMEPQWKFVGKRNGKNKFANIGKKINQAKMPSAIGMAWIYLKEAKAKFDSIHSAEMGRALNEMPEFMADAIEQYQNNPNSQNKYRITTFVYGGVWDGVKVGPANPIQKKICWKVIYG